MNISFPLRDSLYPTLIEVQSRAFFQIPQMTIVGLPSKEVGEAKERIRSAIVSSDFRFPNKKVVLNLAPADRPKKGTGADLAMTLATLNLEYPHLLEPFGNKIVAWGELGLDGSVRSCGALMRALYAACVEKAASLIFPKSDLSLLAEYIDLLTFKGILSPHSPLLLIPISDLKDLTKGQALSHSFQTKTTKRKKTETANPHFDDSDLLPISPALERAITISLAGNHHLYLSGPRGSGKTHSCHWISKLFEKIYPSAPIEHYLLHDLRIDSPPCPPKRTRLISPLARPQSLQGHWSHGVFIPGELSLAHGGILIADEFPEWSRDSIEILRQPLESGQIQVTRVHTRDTLPAKFLFIATGNLCPCGGFWPGAPSHGKTSTSAPACNCLPQHRLHYQRRTSQAILDRIDIKSCLTPLDRPSTDSPPTIFDRILNRVQSAILPHVQDSDSLEGNAPSTSLHESLRSQNKIGLLARTICRIEGKSKPTSAHWAEAASWGHYH